MIWYKIATVWRDEPRIQKARSVALVGYIRVGEVACTDHSMISLRKKSRGFKSSNVKTHEEGH